MGRQYELDCPVARTLDIIGERWTILILRDLFLHGSRRFQDFVESLTGIAPNTLSSRLKVLETEGIIEREILGRTVRGITFIIKGVLFQTLEGDALHKACRYNAVRINIITWYRNAGAAYLFALVLFVGHGFITFPFEAAVTRS